MGGRLERGRRRASQRARSATALITLAVVAAAGLGVAPKLVPSQQASAKTAYIKATKQRVASRLHAAGIPRDRTSVVNRLAWTRIEKWDVMAGCKRVNASWKGTRYKAKCNVSWYAREYRYLKPSGSGLVLLRICRLEPSRAFARRWGTYRTVLVSASGRTSLDSRATTKCTIIHRYGWVDSFGRYFPVLPPAPAPAAPPAAPGTAPGAPVIVAPPPPPPPGQVTPLS